MNLTPFFAHSIFYFLSIFFMFLIKTFIINDPNICNSNLAYLHTTNENKDAFLF